MEDQHLIMLGQIHGKLEALEAGQAEIKTAVTSIDGRLRAVETKAAGWGALSGGVVAVGIALIKAKLGGAG